MPFCSKTNPIKIYSFWIHVLVDCLQRVFIKAQLDFRFESWILFASRNSSDKCRTAREGCFSIEHCVCVWMESIKLLFDVQVWWQFSREQFIQWQKCVDWCLVELDYIIWNSNSNRINICRKNSLQITQSHLCFQFHVAKSLAPCDWILANKATRSWTFPPC